MERRIRLADDPSEPADELMPRETKEPEPAPGSGLDDSPPSPARLALGLTERHQYLRRWVVRKPGRVVLVPVDQTDWILAVENYVRVYAGAESWLLRSQIGDLESELDPLRFLRIHRSAIVYLPRVRELVVLRSSWSVVLENGTVVRCGRHYHDNVARLLSGYL
jgi:two-component system LytT family response regulator